MRHKDAVEWHLELFAVEETTILSDLTTTFFEASGTSTPKARYGETKRLPLVSLGLVLEMNGLPKDSRVFEGTISEPTTLQTMIRRLAGRDISEHSLLKPAVLLDAGGASEANIQWLKDTHTVSLPRGLPQEKEAPPP
jgi:hypothetical protein